MATIGTFDGIHCGHKVVINQLVATAKRLGLPSLIITFEPHPRLVLSENIAGLKLLNTREEKVKHLSNLNVDFLLFLPFTHDFSQLTSRKFIEGYLINGLKVNSMVIGYDHHFGKKEGEKNEDVVEILKEFGIGVERIPEQDVQNVIVSSTKIRNALRDGDMAVANKLLGYEYSIDGLVIHGNQLGRELSFPTANLMLSSNMKMLPADGVYAVKVRYKTLTLNGMMNIGYKPTVNSTEKTIEIHIFDFDKTIYGEKLEVMIHHRIREERKFESLTQLKNQLSDDKFQINNILRD